MVKNEKGFASGNRYPLQPDYYTKIFDGWAAVYLTNDDEEYHIQLNPDSHDNSVVDEIEILKQTPTHRVQITTQKFPSIIKAVEHLNKTIAK